MMLHTSLLVATLLASIVIAKPDHQLEVQGIVLHNDNKNAGDRNCTAIGDRTYLRDFYIECETAYLDNYEIGKAATFEGCIEECETREDCVGLTFLNEKIACRLIKEFGPPGGRVVSSVWSQPVSSAYKISRGHPADPEHCQSLSSGLVHGRYQTFCGHANTGIWYKNIKNVFVDDCLKLCTEAGTQCVGVSFRHSLYNNIKDADCYLHDHLKKVIPDSRGEFFLRDDLFPTPPSASPTSQCFTVTETITTTPDNCCYTAFD